MYLIVYVFILYVYNKMKKELLPVVMKFEGKYETYENGKKRHDVTMNADYDGADLELNVDDKLQNKKTHLQLSNDELFDLMSTNHTKQGLLKQLEDELQKKKTKRGRKTQRRRVIKNKRKKQTRRKK
jgi:hypothetical protein